MGTRALKTVGFAIAGLLAAGGSAFAQEPAAGAPFRTAACPSELPSETRCWSGKDEVGAFYWIAIPKAWNRSLVVHSHGGPSLQPPKEDAPVSDLKRFAVTVQEGFAWAGSSYRHSGFGVRDAAADTDRLRGIFWTAFGRPKRTLLHGQSWGGNVAAKTAEVYGRDPSGKPNYDGVILTSGVLGGGSRSYDFRVDLRVVYQFYCKNLPAPGEPAYPLWQGLGAGVKMSRDDVLARLDACTGVSLKPAERTPEQARNLADILAVARVPERTLASHLDWATLTFRDLVLRQLKGDNPFTNRNVVYNGSHNDAALNKGVVRFSATTAGAAALAYDADLSGKLIVPTLTMHAEDDPTAFVELESAFRDTVERAGAKALLVQELHRRARAFKGSDTGIRCPVSRDNNVDRNRSQADHPNPDRPLQRSARDLRRGLPLRCLLHSQTPLRPDE